MFSSAKSSKAKNVAAARSAAISEALNCVLYLPAIIFLSDFVG
jgi:hypothetical protein